MDIKDYEELLRMGYEFDIVEQCFLVPAAQIESFKKPEKYEGWKVKEYNTADYFYNRIVENLGIRLEPGDNDNIIELSSGWVFKDPERTKNKIFTFNKHGDIEILLYSLRREPFFYEKGNREKYAVLTRLAPHREVLYTQMNAERKTTKYIFDRGKTGNHLMWHPKMIEKYEQQEPGETLVLTEGYFKAWAAAAQGIDIVGLPSISIYTEKKGSDELHPEIIDYIAVRKFKNVLILWDGDCRNISVKSLSDGKDIYKRPGDFVKHTDSIRKKLRQQFAVKSLNIWFGRIKSEDINGEPKGLDDLLQAKPDEIPQITKELTAMEGASYYFRKINISTDVAIKNVYSDFKLDYVEKFYKFHSEIIGSKSFVFRNNTYAIKDGEPILIIPATVKNYKRIGTEYYKLQEAPIKIHSDTGEVMHETQLVPWKKDTISFDHGKEMLRMIESYEGFTNVANHIDYQQVVNGFWNLYQDLKHELIEGDYSTIDGLMHHIFGEQYEYGLDYLKLLYEYPSQKVPIFCLVSKQQQTGKSTFMNFLKYIFKGNMGFISAKDLDSDFNSQWIDKKIVACEETVLEKRQPYELVKAVSTAETYSRNEKLKAGGNIPCLVSFVFATNDEDGFLRLSLDDDRFWVRKIPTIQTKINKFNEKLQEEIPHFLYALSKRELKHFNGNFRMGFDPMELRTKAFYNVVKNSEPGIVKDLRIKIEEYFLKYGGTELHICVKDLQDYFGVKNSFGDHYTNKMVKEYFSAEKVTYPGRYSFFIDNSNDPDKPMVIRGKGRYFIFKAENFIQEGQQTNRTPPMQKDEELPF